MSGPGRRVDGGAGPVAGPQLPAGGAPFRLAVVLRADVAPAHVAHDRAVAEAHDVGRDPARGVLLHERHVLVGEAGHRACHADAAHVRAAPDAALPAADRDVALDDRAPTAELDEAAVVRAVLGR